MALDDRHCIDPISSLDLLRAERTTLAALRGADLTAAVDSCPAWSLYDLLSHLAMVHRMAMRMLATPPTAEAPPASERPPEADDGDAIWNFLDDGMARLLAEFETRDLTAPCRAFVGPVTIAWWLRRQLHETTVHRWDAQAACGQVGSIDPTVAADGVDEWLDLQVGRGWPATDGVVGTIHLHATDLTAEEAESGDGEWFIELGDTLAWRHGHQKGDVALRGSRSDLLLASWGRRPVSSLDTVGDVALFERFLESLKFRPPSSGARPG